MMGWIWSLTLCTVRAFAAFTSSVWRPTHPRQLFAVGAHVQLQYTHRDRHTHAHTQVSSFFYEVLCKLLINKCLWTAPHCAPQCFTVQWCCCSQACSVCVELFSSLSRVKLLWCWVWDMQRFDSANWEPISFSWSELRWLFSDHRSAGQIGFKWSSACVFLCVSWSLASSDSPFQFFSSSFLHHTLWLTLC